MKIIKTVTAENRFFEESELVCGNMDAGTEMKVVNVFDDVRYQEIVGFGAALTESAAYCYSLMDSEEKEKFLTAYFDKDNGIGYNFGRVHINSCDFSIDAYTCVEEGDTTLETFNIERDKKYIIPFIKDVLKHTGDELVLFASPWSPPAYMKDNGSVFRGGVLKEEYKELWAHFYAKFIKAYAAEEIKISAVTVQNEPKAVQTWESCYYTAADERDFIEKYLAPALDSEGLSDIKIIIWDHNKERVYDRARTVLSNPKVSERVWAVGHHWYSGGHFDGLRLVKEQFDKPNICTEFCAGMKSDLKMLGERYGIEICENLNNYCIGICDWNILLDRAGGPSHNRPGSGNTGARNETDAQPGCYAPIMLDADNKMNITPVYYYMGHFSKYIKRGAVRIASTKYSRFIYVCAFINPDGEKAAVIMNTADEDDRIAFRYDWKCTEIELPAHSIATVLF